MIACAAEQIAENTTRMSTISTHLGRQILKI